MPNHSTTRSRRLAAAPHLSVILTNYNEAANLNTGVLEQIYTYLQRQPQSFELILVDDGSTDDTLTRLRLFAGRHRGVRVIANPHLGKAGGIITGALAAAGNIILFTDTDQSTPVSELDKLLPFFDRGYSLVIGSRARRQGAPLYRQILAYGMVVMRTLILNLPYRDTQCGFKAYTRPAATRIFSVLKRVHPPNPISYPNTNPGFDLEVFYLARQLKFGVAEVPVIWQYRESKRVSFVKDAVNGIKELLLVRWKALTHVYGI